MTNRRLRLNHDLCRMVKYLSYTPGPWKIGALLGDPDGKSYEYPTIYRLNEDGSTTYVADIMGALSPSAWPNACLIAATPDLLEACKWALAAEKTLPKGIRHPELEKALENSIAKAKGKS